MTELGRTGTLVKGLGWGTLIWLFACAAAPASARAEARAPQEPAGAAPLHDLPVSLANKALLPLFDKWVMLGLRDGQSAEGRLVDIRVAYVVLRGQDGKDRRIPRKDVASVRQSASPMPARVTAESLRGLVGRYVRLHKKDGTQVVGILRSVSETDSNLETSSGVVGVGISGLIKAEATEAPPSLRARKGRFASMIGRVVRIDLLDGGRVQGELREASEKELKIESDGETITVSVDQIKTFLVGKPKTKAESSGEDGASAPGEAPAVARPAARPTEWVAGRSVLPHHYSGKGLADQALREHLLRKYSRIRDNGARLRNWGLGLIVASLVLEVVGNSIAFTTRNEGVAKFGYSLIALSSTSFLVGVVMAPWGQVRHFRGIDMVNHVYLTR